VAGVLPFTEYRLAVQHDLFNVIAKSRHVRREPIEQVTLDWVGGEIGNQPTLSRIRPEFV